MFKKIIFPVLAIVAIAFTACDKIKDAIIIPNTSVSFTVPVNSLKKDERWPTAGTRDTTLALSAVKDAVGAVGVGASLVKSVNVTEVELSIPTTATWGFENIATVDILMDGQVIGSYRGGKTGKTILLDIPATKPDIKTPILAGSIKFGYSISSNAVTTDQKMTVKTTFKVTL